MIINYANKCTKTVFMIIIRHLSTAYVKKNVFMPKITGSWILINSWSYRFATYDYLNIFKRCLCMSISFINIYIYFSERIISIIKIILLAILVWFTPISYDIFNHRFNNVKCVDIHKTYLHKMFAPPSSWKH